METAPTNTALILVIMSMFLQNKQAMHGLRTVTSEFLISFLSVQLLL